MSAQATTKLQVNYKLADGTLINVYGDNGLDLKAQIEALQGVAAEIRSTFAALNMGGTNMAGAVATVQAALGGTVVQSYDSTPAASIPEGSCKHGALVWRESKPGAPKAWKGWFCPSPKGTPDQCSPKFVK